MLTEMHESTATTSQLRCVIKVQGRQGNTDMVWGGRNPLRGYRVPGSSPRRNLASLRRLWMMKDAAIIYIYIAKKSAVSLRDFDLLRAEGTHNVTLQRRIPSSSMSDSHHYHSDFETVRSLLRPHRRGWVTSARYCWLHGKLKHHKTRARAERLQKNKIQPPVTGRRLACAYTLSFQ